MKILLVSAGTKLNGATERAVKEAKDELEKIGCEYDIFRLFTDSIPTCSGCGGCSAEGSCIYDDIAKKAADKVHEFDGYIFFTPVHYGGASGTLKSALARMFYSKKADLKYKFASAVAVSRRGGNLSALEEIARFFKFASMFEVSGNYPGIIHGCSYEEAEFDKEGLQTVRSIVNNMVWLIKCVKYAEDSGIQRPKEEEKIKTNYIRQTI